MNPVPVNEPVAVTCNPEGDRGLPEAMHYSYFNGTQLAYNGSDTWTETFHSVKDTAEITCSMGNHVGSSPLSSSQELTILGKIKMMILKNTNDLINT